MKIFAGRQIKELDRYTIEHERITSLDLMERSARALTRAVTEEWNNATPVVVFAGPGNNGGDALAVARMLTGLDYAVSVWLFNIGRGLSENCEKNKRRLQEMKKLRSFIEVTEEFDPPTLKRETLVIDGLFGSGLNKPLSGGFAALVKYINQSPSLVVSIDMPSGLMSEDNTYNIRANIIRADLTLTLGQLKLSFLFPENQPFIGRLKVLDIRLSAEGIEKIDAEYTLIEEKEVRKGLLARDPFAHKGQMGTALIISGSYGMAGAAILAARACLRSGVGKVTCVSPRCNNTILQIAVPEAVIKPDSEETIFSEPVDTEGYNAMCIGPGIGQNETTATAMISQVRRSTCPVVLDADAINILSSHRAWTQQLPRDIILTPHPKEFDRLEGPSADSFERLTKARKLSERLSAFILLKGHFSALCLPDGHVLFSSTGNAGMATGGSGDVLTGIITGLLARGYKQEAACVTGMYLHGLAGDIAAKEMGEESLVAGDIIRCLPKAFKKLKD